MKKKDLVIAIYNNPETLPPTLHAIEFLSAKFDNIYIIYRNIGNLKFWQYPDNVKLLSFNELVNYEKIFTDSFFKKLRHFLKFTILFLNTILKIKPDTILIYDSLPVLSYRIIKKISKKPRILWYHNHDVTNIENVKSIKKYSLVWWAWKSESWLFPYLNYFSLPALERKKYFLMDKLKGEFLFIPNYPSKIFFNKYNFSAKKSINNIVNISFQGAVKTNYLTTISFLIFESRNSNQQ